MKSVRKGTEMSNPLRVAIIIPCYNEEDSVMNLYNEIKAITFSSHFFVEPIFINDCSTDNTKYILKQNNTHFIDLPVNLGIGGAVQTGFKYALRNEFDIAVQMDGDGQHPPSELEKIIVSFITNKVDVVIGSRYLKKEGFQSSILRRFGINYFKFLNKFLVGININDSTSGYRAINKKAMEIVSKYYPDEYPEPESIVLYAMMGLKIMETPVTMRERQGGVSSIKSYKTIYYMFKVTIGTVFLFIRLKFNGKRYTI
jgi:glycosyltransferase involved in cell wall biosynthesis